MLKHLAQGTGVDGRRLGAGVPARHLEELFPRPGVKPSASEFGPLVRVRGVNGDVSARGVGHGPPILDPPGRVFSADVADALRASAADKLEQTAQFSGDQRIEQLGSLLQRRRAELTELQERRAKKVERKGRR